MRSDNTSVSVADTRPANVIPIADDEAFEEEDSDDSAATDPVRVIDEDALAEAEDEVASESETDSSSADATDDGDAAADATDDGDAAADATDDDDDAADGDAAADATEDDATDEASEAEDDDAVRVIEEEDLPADDDASDEVAEDSGDAAEAAPPAADPTPTPVPAAPPAPPVSPNGEQLGTGGGVDDAECALDRLVIYAGARVGGVAGRLRTALQQSGFGAGCAAPVTILASNCPLQFSGVLGQGSGYDPNQPFVASSASVNRETLTAVLGSTGYRGSAVNILNFSYVNADKPGEQWIALFIPPSFSGWEQLASNAGVPATTQGLCGPTGRVGG